MATPHEPEPVTLIVGLLSSRTDVLDAACERLEQLFGAASLKSNDIPFTWTPYYETEMGSGLIRRFLSFKDKVSPGRLAEIKLSTNLLEAEFAHEHTFVKRPINIDPGYICGSKLVLASAKDRSQRIYLSGGIYCEITLEYRRNAFSPLETTYSDYKSPEYLEFFTRVRERHLGHV